MSHHALNNPVWSALTSDQAYLASGGDHARRYPAAIAPFIGMVDDSPASAAAMATIVAPGDIVCAIGVLPTLDAQWRILTDGDVGQLTRPTTAPAPAAEDGSIRLLTTADGPAMNQLMTLVYPGFFRPGTASLGDYYGIHHRGQLIAMVGERMRMTGHQEISAVCTHPQFTGQGLAARLIMHVVAHINARNMLPFLHVEAENQRAWSLYERLGFQLRTTLPLWKLQRLPAS